MSTNARVAWVTSHGAFHASWCRNLQRLAHPPTPIKLRPDNNTWRGWVVDGIDDVIWPARCCERRFYTREQVTRVWESTE